MKAGRLAETWIIFITETDVFGKNLPVYTIEQGLAEGREETRYATLMILLMSFTEEELLYDPRFRGLHITQEELNAAKGANGGAEQSVRQVIQ